jgi:hypothetical protein
MLKKMMMTGLLIAGVLGVMAQTATGANVTLNLHQADVCQQSPSAQTTAANVQEFIDQCLSVSSNVKTALSAASQSAIAGSRLSAEETLDMLQKLESSSATQAQKEQLLTTMTNSLNNGVPIDVLMSELLEGISLGAPISLVVSNVQEIAQTLQEVKNLLDSKGIAASQYGQTEADTAISEMTQALEDYIANSSNASSDAQNSDAVESFVDGRLQNLIGRGLSQTIFSAIQSNVQGAELSVIAVAVCSRRNLGC